MFVMYIHFLVDVSKLPNFVDCVETEILVTLHLTFSEKKYFKLRPIYIFIMAELKASRV